MSFDGKRFINAGDIANFTYSEPFTLAAWIYPTASDGVIVSRALAGDQGEQGWGLYLLEGKLEVNLSQRYADDGLRIESVDTLPLNEWQHVLVTYDGKRVPESFRLYVNARRGRSTRCSTASTTRCGRGSRCASGPAGPRRRTPAPPSRCPASRE